MADPTELKAAGAATTLARLDLWNAVMAADARHLPDHIGDLRRRYWRALEHQSQVARAYQLAKNEEHGRRATAGAPKD